MLEPYADLPGWTHYQRTETDPNSGAEQVIPWWPADAAFTFSGAAQTTCVIAQGTVQVVEVSGPFPRPQPTTTTTTTTTTTPAFVCNGTTYAKSVNVTTAGNDGIDVTGVGAGGPPYTGGRPSTAGFCALNVNNTSGGDVPGCFKTAGGAETDTTISGPPFNDQGLLIGAGNCPAVFYW